MVNKTDLWLTESHTPGYSVNWKVKSTIYRERTPYQDLAIVETQDFGRALILDGIVQTTEKDEFIYHEMISHIAMFSHPNPEKVLVIGGGDGGTVREILKHSQAKEVVLVEIDEAVVRASLKFLPSISSKLRDQRVKLRFEDGIAFVNSLCDEFDVIIVDSSDPIGPAAELFSRRFYRGIYKALKKDGIFVAQTESPIFNSELLQDVCSSIRELFPISKTYLSAIPTYIGGFWTFTIGSKMYDPVQIRSNDVSRMELKYYNSEVHKAAFVLPEYVKQVVG